MSEFLKSCPFCGEIPVIIKRGNSATRRRAAIVACTTPLCRIEMKVGAIRNTLEWCEQMVIERWNTRKESTNA